MIQKLECSIKRTDSIKKGGVLAQRKVLSEGGGVDNIVVMVTYLS